MELIDQFAVKIFSAFDICISSNLETSKYLEEFQSKEYHQFWKSKISWKNFKR